MILKKPFLLLIILMFSANLLVAQSIKDSLSSSFQEFQINNLQEKIFVHTNRESYLNDELIWFKIYNVDGFVHQALDISKIAYVEVLNEENKPILQVKIELKKGLGNGSLKIPSSIPTGIYRLRAYTNWMKNYSSNFFFEKSLTIINTKLKFEETSEDITANVEINLFPEGGNLVEGLESIVAAHAFRKGKGVDFKGFLINANSDTLETFNSHKFGMGKFKYTPELNVKFHLAFQFYNGENVIKDLPKAKANGVRLKLDSKEDRVLINLQSTGASKVFLLVHTRGVLKEVQEIELTNGIGNMIVAKDLLGDGISHFTLFDENKKPLCERLFFKFPKSIFNIVVNTNKEIYNIREKVSMAIKASLENNQMLSSNLSMSVFKMDSLEFGDKVNINNQLWLSSDLIGEIESPDYYFRTGDEVAVDNLMLTHGWRRFNWDSLQKKSFDFLPEYIGHLVKGKMTNKISDLPTDGIQGYISVRGKKSQFRTSMSDREGKVLFDTKDFYHDGEMIVQVEASKDSLFNIQIDNPFSTSYSNKTRLFFDKEKVVLGELSKRNKALEIQRVFHAKHQNIFLEPLVNGRAFYSKPEVTYKLDDYVRFPKMEDVLREYVTPVMVRKRKDKFYLTVFEESGSGSFPGEPLILLDGLPIFDTDRIMNYNPLKVERLEILKRQYYFENLLFNGVLSFHTYDGNLSGFKLDPHTTVIDYEGLQNQRVFYSPIYETEPQRISRLPDFRTLLNWTPEIKTNENGSASVEFYTSDLPGNYAVIIQGLTEDGKTGSNIFHFDVK